MKVIRTEGAANDLAEIVRYIDSQSTEAGVRVAKTIFDELMRLPDAPYIGRRRENDNSRELLFVPWPYVAVYEVIANEIYIKGIRHTSQDRR